MKNLIYSLIFVFLFASCGVDKKKEEEQKHIDGKTKDLTELNEKIEKDPSNASLYHQRAKVFYDQKKLPEASSDIEKAIQLDSSKAGYFLTSSDIFFVQNKTSRSKKDLEKCISLDPENIDCLMKLSELYLYVQNYKKSIEHLDRVLKVDKHNPKAYFLKGMNFKEMGDTNLAISSMQTTVEQDPDYYNAYIQLGLLHAARKQAIAVDYYNNALNLNPQSIEANYNKGIFYQEMGDFKKAIESYNIILQIDSNYAHAHYNLGYIQFIQKNYQASIPHFNKAYKSDSQYADALYMQGLAYENLGEKNKARTIYLNTLQLDPEHEKSRNGLERIK